ncbi:hypothetical protein BJV77DRAFT_963815 [Russula vinacea]|nr:hypothetical protein BJV77DRAFT_963815 [Russula vinacea]
MSYDSYPTMKPSKYDKSTSRSGAGGSVGQNVQFSARTSADASSSAEGAFTTRENSDVDAYGSFFLDRQMNRYTSRGPPKPPTGVPDRGKKTPTTSPTTPTTQRQTPQRIEQQIQIPAQDSNVASRPLPHRQQTNQPTGGQTPHLIGSKQTKSQGDKRLNSLSTNFQPIVAQTPQTTEEGTRHTTSNEEQTTDKKGPCPCGDLERANHGRV